MDLPNCIQVYRFGTMTTLIGQNGQPTLADASARSGPNKE
jgi:hypothetical protein